MTQQSFARARSEEQRAARREAILDAAAAMLAESRVGNLRLNQLARRVGLAKSNVLRYFESREAVLLELLDREFGGWLDGIGQALEASPSPGAVPASQVDRLASVMARAARERPLFCELLSNAATVLEHNVSGEVAAAYKRGALAHAARLMDLVARVLPLGGADATVRVAGAVSLGVGGLWGMCRPSPGMEAAYLEHPELAVFRIDFEAALREYLEVLLTGLVSLRGRTEP